MNNTIHIPFSLQSSHDQICTAQDYEESDERCVVASASIKKLGEALIQSTFPVEAHMNLEKNGEHACIRSSYTSVTLLLSSIIHTNLWACIPS